MTRRLNILMLLPALATVVGCADPAHQQQLALRRDNMERTLNLFAEAEARRPGNLARTADVARRQNEEDVQKLHRDLDALGRGIDYEFQRFHDRQPLYQRRIGEELRGKPETIEQTLPYVLY
jgi:hypothetical protein